MRNNSFEAYCDNGVTLYGYAEFTNSNGGAKCVIGEFSRVRNSNLGEYVRIDRNNFLNEVYIGSYSYTGPFDMIFKCDIGNFSSISYGVTIGPPEHQYNRMSTHPFIYEPSYEIFDIQDVIRNDKFDKHISIGNDVWIGCNSTVLRGISIGDGAIIGANSIVNKDIPPYAIAVGCPAKIIKYRFPGQIIQKLLEIKWWNWSIDKIRLNKPIFQKDLTLEQLDRII